MKRPFQSDAVEAAFAALPDDSREIAMILRDLIFDVADDTPEAGQIEEALRWGQPSYLTPETKSGTTLRLGQSKNTEGCALFTHCQSSVMRDHAAMFPGMDRIEGNRAIVFATADDIEPMRLRLLVRHALTYHL